MPESRSLLRLALPILGAQLAQAAMGVIDTMMAGRVSAVDLAGVALGFAILHPLSMLFMGVLQAVTPSVSQLDGAGRRGDVGEVIRQALWLAAAASGLILVVLMQAGPLLELAAVDSATIAITVAFLHASAWGVPALMGYFVLRFLSEGLGYARPAMFIAVSALLLKIPLNLLFIHGALGIPAMGGVGCGVSTALVMWFEMSLILLVVSRGRFKATGWWQQFSAPRAAPMLALVRIGGPIGITLFFEVAFFSSVAIMLGRFGAEVVAAHTIAMNTGWITYMFPVALGMAATIRVGFNVGAGQHPQALMAAKVAYLMTLALTVIMCLTVVLGRHAIARLYSTDTEVLALAGTLMLFLAVFQLFDNVQATTIGALRGYKDTRVPMLVTLVGYWLVGLPLALSLGFGWWGSLAGPYGFWTGLTAALMFVAIGVSLRLWWLSHHPASIRRLNPD